MVHLHKFLIFIIVFYVAVHATKSSNDALIVKSLMDIYDIPDSLFDSVASTDKGRVIKLKLLPVEHFYKKAVVNKPITILPAAISELDELRELIINNVKSIPLGIYKLKKLKKIQIKSNYLKSVPEDILQLKSLKVIDIRGDSLCSISKKLYGISTLEELTLYGSDNAFMPKGIEYLENLIELNICGLKLVEDFFKKDIQLNISTFKLYNSKLPSSVKYLAKLKRLNYGELSTHVQGYGHKNGNDFKSVDKIISTSKYKIKTIPESIKELKNLRHLSLTSFHINKLPLFLSEIDSLETFFVSHINLDTIPKFLITFDSLKSLTLKNCNINFFPSEMEKNFNLEKLDLSSNNLTELPNDLLKFTNLKKLNIYGNKICKSVDDEMEKWLINKTNNQNWQDTQKCYEK